MLKSTIILNAMTMPKNLKEGTEDCVRDILAFRTYSIEKERILSRQLNGKKVADLINEAEKMFTGKDWTEFSDSEMTTAFAGSTDKMTELRDDFKECEAHLASCKCDSTTFKALADTDRIFLTLMVHSVVSSEKLSADLIPEDLGGLIKTYYTHGKQVKGINASLKKCFYRFCGQDGDMFTGLKLKNSDMNGEDIRNFLAAFGGKAGRNVKSKDGKNTVSDFDYKNDFSNRSVASAITNLLGVYLLSRGDKVELEVPTVA